MNLNNITVKQLENINYGKENMGNSFEKFLNDMFENDPVSADYYILSNKIKNKGDQDQYLKDKDYKKALFDFINEQASAYGYDTEEWHQDSGVEV